MLIAATGLLAGCGARSSLGVDSTKEVCHGGWEGEFFVAAAADTPLDIAAADTPFGIPATAMDLHPSNGDGSFGEPWKIDMGERFSGVVIDDLDDDGHLEIHAWGQSSGIEYLLDYSCDKEDWIKAPIEGGAPPPRHAFSSFGDVNKDGRVDAVGWVPAKGADGQPNDDAFDVYTSLGGPGGAFTHTKTGLNLKGLFVWWLAPTRHIRDMNGDGCADLVFLRYDHGNVAESSVYLAKGDCAGGFGEPAIIATTPFPGTGDDIGDLDGDAAVDLLAGLDDDGDAGQTWVLKGDGQGALGSPIPAYDVSNVESAHDGAGWGSVFLHDWDHDGRLDVLSAYTTDSGFSSPQIDIRMNKGDLGFGDPEIVVPAPLAYGQWLVGPASK